MESEQSFNGNDKNLPTKLSDLGYENIKELSIDGAKELLRKEVQKCESLEGFFINRDLNSGSSMFSCSFLEELQDIYKCSKTAFSIDHSSGTSFVNNSVFSLSNSLHCLDMDFIFQTRSLQNYSHNIFQIQSPMQSDLIKLNAYCISSYISPLRSFEEQKHNLLS